MNYVVDNFTQNSQSIVLHKNMTFFLAKYVPKILTYKLFNHILVSVYRCVYFNSVDPYYLNCYIRYMLMFYIFPRQFPVTADDSLN